MEEQANVVIRRRMVEAVRAEIPDNSSIEEDDFKSSSFINGLLDKGRGLMHKAEQTGFHELSSVVQSLNVFVEAAAKGSKEATKTLKLFAEERSKDVIEQLPDELQEILGVFAGGSETEQAALRVASDMFDIMAGDEPDRVIPRDHLAEAAQKLMMKEVEVVGPTAAKSAEDFRQSVNKLLFVALVDSKNGPVVTRESFCYVACKYAKGEMPISLLGDSDSQLSPEDTLTFNKANWIKKFTEYPRYTKRYLMSSSMQYIEKHGVRWVWSLFSLKQFYFFLFVYLVPKINISFVLTTLATIIFFGSFVVMCICTLQVASQSRRVDTVIGTSHVFKNYLINTKLMEHRLIKRLAVPYLSFLGALLLAVLTIGGAYQQLIYYNVLAVTAGAMAGAVFFTFNCWRSPLVVLSVMTRLPGWFMVFLYLIKVWWPVPEFLFFFGKQIIAIPVLPGVYLDFNLTTLLQVPLQIVLIVWFAYQQSWHNLYSGIGPYVLFISWWIFCRDLVNQGSLLYFILLIPGIFLCIALLPFMLMLIPLSPLLVLFYYGMSWQFVTSLSIVIAGGLVIWKLITSYKWLKETQLLNIPLEYLILGQLMVLLPILLGVTVSYAQSFKPSALPLVTVDQYSNYCSPHLWKDHGNSIQTQLNCYHLKDRLLEASAVVESVQITQVTNSHHDSLVKLPDAARISLTCLMGETTPMCGNDESMITCVYKGCHFDSGNTYEITIKVLLEPSNLPASLTAIVGHSQLNEPVFLNLAESSAVKFNATIVSGMGSESLTLRLKLLSSSSGNYSASSAPDIEKAGYTIMTSFGEGLQRTINFLLEIVLGYTPSDHYKPRQQQ